MIESFIVIFLLDIGYYKLKKDKAAAGGGGEASSLKLLCPFVQCLKRFTETGNLKTHLRTHVINKFLKSVGRLVIDHSSVIMRAAENNL